MWYPIKIALLILMCFTTAMAASTESSAPTPTPTPTHGVLFEAVRVFDGTAEQLTEPMQVLVVGNRIVQVSAEPIAPPAELELSRIQGAGRTLMPGLIDAHTHVMYATLSQQAILTSDLGFLNVAATKAAADMLMRGFTSIRAISAVRC